MKPPTVGTLDVLGARVLILRDAHSTDGVTAGADLVAPASQLVRVEVEEESNVLAARIKRARPIEAVRAHAAERLVQAHARSGQKDGVTIRSST